MSATTETQTRTTASTNASQAVPASQAPAPRPSEPPDRRRWWTLAVLCLSLLVIVVDTTIVNVAIPTLASDLHVGSTALTWIVDAYTLVFAALLLPAGSLGDRFGRHHALAGGLLIFGAGSLGAALSTTATELIVWRGVMGIGAAFAMPATMAVLTATFTVPAERAKALGIWSAVSGLGVAIGPTAGGWLLQHYSWSAIFAVNLPIIAIALIAGHFLVPPSVAPHRPRLDPVGAVLATAGLGTLTYAIIQASDSGWGSTSTLVRFAAAAVLLAVFAASQLRSDHPMLDLGLFRNARFTSAAVAVMVLFFGLGGYTFVLTQIYQFILGYSPLGAGVRSLPAAVMIMVGAPLGTRVAARFGNRAAITTGMLTAAAGLAFFALASGDTGYAHYLIASAATSLGIGLTMAPAIETVMSSLPPAKTGIGSAVSNTTRNLGTVLGVAVIGSIAATTYTRTMPSGTAGSDSIGAAAAVAHHLPAPAAQALHTTASDAFVHGADLGVIATAAIVLITAVLTFRHLPGKH
ncbi:MFS transporter [Actinomadura barringtoniae]|uniref:MFS transporter n=1 Tax=Actinomadura barringtoniae TaxID=1427535 RepID=A0A939T9J8_9ACTN|nr:MFS transporter [Actinomadura barringtoniae]MBO2448045.1 MFS transporter [Actinomadura barringtoniae]